MGNGHTARWRLPVLCEKGGGALSAHRPDREVCGCGGQVRLCRGVLWWECAKGPFLFGTLHPSPTLVWSGGLHPTQIIRWPVLSDLFGRCPDGSQPSVHSGPGTCRCLPPFNVNSFRFPQCPPRFLPQWLQWADVLIQEDRHDGYSTLLASLATFPSLVFSCEARLSFLPHLHQVHWTLSLDSPASRKESTDGGNLLEGLNATGFPLPHVLPGARASRVHRPSDGHRTTEDGPHRSTADPPSSPCATRARIHGHPPCLPPSPSTRAGCLQSTTLPSAPLVLPRPFHCPFCHGAAMQQWSRPETTTH